MKRFLLLLIALLTFASATAYAQYAPDSKVHVTSRGAQIFCNGERLSKEEALTLFSDYGGLDRSEFYSTYRKGYRTGVGLSIGGASAIVLGTMTTGTAAVVAVVLALPLAASDQPMPRGLNACIYTGAALSSLGSLALLAGIPTSIVYRTRIKDLAMGYNSISSKKAELTFGPTASGMGLALNF